MGRLLCFSSLLLGLFSVTAHAAAPVRLAVASNFADTAHRLIDAFEQQTPYLISLSAGSSGKLFAQIQQGAPFDIFLSADVERPQRLEASARGLPNTRFTYAIGSLVLCGTAYQQGRDLAELLTTDTVRHIAIANPRTAPYGAAAKQTLEALGVWQQIRPRLVQGESVGQVAHFVVSNNAQLGFMALTQVIERPQDCARIPQGLHNAVEQQAILLSSSPGALAFSRFLRSASALEIIRARGFELPNDQ